MNRPSDITVLYKGKPIKGDLSAAQIMIANAGQEAIEAQDVLVNLSLVVSNAEILERSFLTPPLKGTEFTLATNLPNNRLDLNWNVLERGDNPVIQIVYAGMREAPIKLEGRIKGQQSAKEVAWPRLSTGRNWAVFVDVMVGGAIGSMAGFMVQSAKGKRRNMVLAVLSLLTAAVVFYLINAFVPQLLK